MVAHAVVDLLFLPVVAADTKKIKKIAVATPPVLSRV